MFPSNPNQLRRIFKMKGKGALGRLPAPHSHLFRLTMSISDVGINKASVILNVKFDPVRCRCLLTALMRALSQSQCLPLPPFSRYLEQYSMVI